MNFQQIKALFSTNLIYSNPQITERLRKDEAKRIERGKKKKSLTTSILNSYILSAVFILALFGLQMLFIDFPHYPGYFTTYCALYILMNLSSAVSSLNNVFYESKDFKDYLPLPFNNASVFTAKLLVVTFVVLPFLLPMLALFIITGLMANGILGIIIALLIFVLFCALFMMICIALVALLVQSKIFQKHKKISSTLLTFIPALGTVVGIFFLYRGNSSSSMAKTLVDRPVLFPFLPFHDWLVNPLSLRSAIGFVITLLLLALVYLLLRQSIIPKMFQILLNDQELPKATRKTKKSVSRSFSRQLIAYNMGLMKNQTLWIQTLSTSFVMPLSMLIGMTAAGRIDLSQISDKFFALAIIIGLAFSVLTVNNSSIVSMIISLDRENFSYIRSLPLSLKNYLELKFKFAFLIQLALNLVVTIGIAAFLKTPLLLILGTALGNIFGTYICSIKYFSSDWRYLTLNWTAISQLYGRGGGGMRILITYLVAIIATLLASVAIALLLALVPQPLLINLLLLLLFIGLLIFVHLHYRKKFWSQFD